MKYTHNIHKALIFATQAHNGQTRKDTAKTPYISHPVGVAMILSEYTNDEEVIIAGLLHDVIEDCEVSYEDLQTLFGTRVADIVHEVSEDIALKKTGEKESWKARKEGYLVNLHNDSVEAMLVCGADKIHNLMSLGDVLEVEGVSALHAFNASFEDTMWFYGEVVSVIRAGVPAEMVERYELEWRVVREKIS